MISAYQFHCTYCGKEFGEKVIELAKHIGAAHDPSRGSTVEEENLD